MPNVVTIREAVQRARQDGMPVSEYTLRRWVRSGAFPVRKTGAKNLLFYPNLVRFLQCGAEEDNEALTEVVGGVRRIEQ